MPLVKCQINSSPAGRVPTSDRPRAPQSRGTLTTVLSARGKSPSGESRWCLSQPHHPALRLPVLQGAPWPLA